MKRKKTGRRSVIALAFDRINAWIESKQRKGADFLNQKCADFSTRQLTIGLAAFILLFGSCVAITIWNSLESFGSRSNIPTISVPKHVIVKDTVQIKISPEMISIRKFKIQLDSLERSLSGRLFLDSLKSVRPGLFDSLRLVNSIYNLK